tara:strand:+ start:598 stop:942 length:345 start_codon:yes stop_codon:yes gene_type:complete
MTDKLYNTICGVLLEKENAKKKGWVWEGQQIGFCRVIHYEYLKKNDDCCVILQSVNDGFTFTKKETSDYNGEYFMGNKKYIKHIENKKKFKIMVQCCGNKIPKDMQAVGCKDCF